MMNIEDDSITKCDFTDKPVKGGIAVLARGATGRVCAVMWASREYAEQQGWVISTFEEAVRYAESVPGGWLDAEPSTAGVSPLTSELLLDALDEIFGVDRHA
jgi:hypothetical protein